MVGQGLKTKQYYDVVVVGSGPGGAITGCLLAESGKSVLMIEEGGDFNQKSAEPFSIQEMQQKYRHSGVTVALGKPKVAYVEGKCVGGGSEINSGLYHRPSEEVLNKWVVKHQIKDFSYELLKEHLEYCEDAVNVCKMPFSPSKASLKLHEGAKKLGWKSIEVPRWFKYKSEILPGTRQSMTVTFIPRFLNSGGELISKSKVQKLIKNDEKSWTVKVLEYDGEGENEFEVKAKSVFVAAGAIQTPALLLQSGIKKNIGNSLKMHATVKVLAEYDEELNNGVLGVPVHQVKEFSPSYSFGGAISSKPFIAMSMLDHPQHSQYVMDNWKKVASYYVMIGGGNGKVRNLPFFSEPITTYKISSEDLRSLSEGLRNLCKCLLASGALALYPSISGFPVIRKTDDLLKIPNELDSSLTNLMTIHLMGSCPMGENKATCAVDSYGKVHDHDGLYISDASLLGGAVGANPQGTIMAIVRRNTLKFLELN